MRKFTRRHSLVRLGLLLVSMSLSVPSARSNLFWPLPDGGEFTAVNSHVFNGYARTRLADGSFQPETFVFGDGGVLGTMAWRDPRFENVNFAAITRLLAKPLAAQNYVNAHDPKSTVLLIMVFWGMTIGGSNTMDGALQDRLNYLNASLLGFEREARFLQETTGGDERGQILRDLHAGGMGAIEVNRYYVILRAYDFQAAWKRKQLKLLWETRFSLPERHHYFDLSLPAMAKSASDYFGRNSNGLIQLAPLHGTHIKFGKLKILESPYHPGGEEPAGTSRTPEATHEKTIDGAGAKTHPDAPAESNARSMASPP